MSRNSELTLPPIHVVLNWFEELKRRTPPSETPATIAPLESEDAVALSAGKRLGPYEILSPVGTGGMGEVYRARDSRLGRDVAIKVLPEEWHSDPERLRRFEQEAKAAGALNHPNLLAVYDVGIHNGAPYIVSELLEGETLRERLRPGELSPRKALEMAIAIAHGLSAAHAKGVVHRDLKPGNVFLTKDGHVKILDFGLAKLTKLDEVVPEGETASQATAAGSVIGTAGYMSPEQIRGQAADHRSDIFSLGVVLHEMVSGRRPFRGETNADVMTAVLREDPPELSVSGAKLPPGLERIVRRCLEKQPDDRFHSAHDLALALEAVGTSAPPLPGFVDSATAGERERAAAVARDRKRPSVGRGRERERLREALQQASSVNGLIVAIAGEPGIGKSTLVEDFLSEAESSGAARTIAHGRCSERLAGTEAYLPFIEALAGLAGGDSESEALLKAVAPTWHTQITPLQRLTGVEAARSDVKAASQERLKRELADFFVELSRFGPVLLFLDDLHWADASTVELLAYLARRFDALRLLVLVTYRPTDLLLAGHPFVAVKRDLQARACLREIELGFLSAAEVGAYLDLKFPAHRFPSEFAALVHRQTEGSPLFMTDLLHYLQQRRVIARGDAGWVLGQALPDVREDLPESVRGMILRKIEQLDPEERDLLIAASVQGQRFDSAIVARVLAKDPGQVEERLATLEKIHAFVHAEAELDLPDRKPNVRYRFVHVLYQNELYQSLTPSRRTAISKAVAEALVAAYGDRQAEVASQLAPLFEVAREPGRAADALILASQHALRLFANQEAILLARHGLALLEGVPRDEAGVRRELALQMALGPALSASVGWAGPELQATFTRARELAREVRDPSEEFPALWGLFAYHYVRAEFPLAASIIADLRTLGETTSNRVLLLHAAWGAGAMQMYQGQLEDAAQTLSNCVAMYDPVLDRGLAFVYSQDPGAGALTYQANTYALLGRPQLAARAQARAVTLARQIRHPFTLVYALILAAWAEVLYGAWQPLDERLEEARKLCTEHGFDFIGTWQRAMHGWREVIRGRQTGLAEILAAVSDHAKMGASAGETFLYSLVADAHLRCGDAGAALQAVREGLAKAKRQNETCFEPELLRLRAEASLLRGDDATATESLAEAIGIASRQGSCWFRLRAAKRLAGLYERQGRAEQGRRLLAEAWAAVSPTEQEDLARALEATAPGPQSASGPAPVSIRTSVAVLPFVSLSADPENDYFADGITEDVIAQLSKIAALRVTSRTSAMQFKKRQASLREIGQRLGVAKVLDGSVRRAGTRVRIVAQLVDAASDEHLWAETYDRELSDVFAVQSDVALNVAGSLRAVLSLNERERVQRRPTVNMDAYNEYLLGRHQLNKRSDEGLRLAIAHFERAVALDPGYASAYAGLADAYNIAGLGYSAMPPKDARARAKAAAQHALELDEALPEAHTSLGFGQMMYEWDFRAAEQSFLKAIGLNPSYAPALQWRAQALNVQERFAEGHDSVRRAAELDPLSVVIATERSWPFLYEARWDEALVQLRKALELDPGFALAHYNIGNCYENKGMYEEAIADYEKSVALSGRLPFMLAGLGRAYAIAGRMAEARECLDELLKRAQTTSGVAVSVALVYDAHKDGPRALEWLERGYAEREPFAGCLFMDKWLPFESVRHEPRFQVLLAKIGNPAAR